MPSTVRDRTKELFDSVKLKSETMTGLPSQSRPNHRRSLSSSTSRLLDPKMKETSTRIHNHATKITTYIGIVHDKIFQLESLAKATTTFNDERPQIARLIFDIKQDVDRLENDIKTIDSFIKHTFDINSMSTDHCVCHHFTLLDILRSRYSQLAKSFGKACEVSTKELQRQKLAKDKFGGKDSRKFRRVPRNRLHR